MDTVADFLTRIRNASTSAHEKVDVPASNLRKGVADVLKRTGYIEDYKVVTDGKQGMMRVFLKYNDEGKSPFQAIRRASKPSRRLYVNAKQIPRVKDGYGLAVLSTSKGILSGGEATKQNIGGELLCTLW